MLNDAIKGVRPLKDTLATQADLSQILADLQREMAKRDAMLMRWGVAILITYTAALTAVAWVATR